MLNGSHSPQVGSQSIDKAPGFFVRRDEWRRLKLPEQVRASILQRSASSLHDMTSAADAALAHNTSSRSSFRIPDAKGDEDSFCRSVGPESPAGNPVDSDARSAWRSTILQKVSNLHLMRL
ncbi:unnamed protein product [Protopolystoma xenopodis]|uniref:Uncharacterized protein n=1 Tax=Protopolystoma xenopodis TaxID=117903 RepID=A0A3S5A627_9PLAT|nr:unnamed protein product [Protopolystoma xenopodis]